MSGYPAGGTPPARLRIAPLSVEFLERAERNLCGGPRQQIGALAAAGARASSFRGRAPAVGAKPDLRAATDWPSEPLAPVLFSRAGDSHNSADQPSRPLFGLGHRVAALPEIAGAGGVPAQARMDSDVPAKNSGPR